MIPNQSQPAPQISPAPQNKLSQPVAQAKTKIPIKEVNQKQSSHQTKSKQHTSESKKKQLKPQIKQKQLIERPKTNTTANPAPANVAKTQTKKQDIPKIYKGSPSVLIQLDVDTLASSDPNIMINGTLQQFVIEDSSIIQLYSKPITNKFILKPITASEVDLSKPGVNQNQVKIKQQKQKRLQAQPNIEQNEKNQNQILLTGSGVDFQQKQLIVEYKEQINQKKEEENDKLEAASFSKVYLQKTQDLNNLKQPKPKEVIQRQKIKNQQLQKQNKKAFAVIFTEQNIQKLQDIEIKLQDQFIHAWIIQVFYFLHPRIRAESNGVFFRIQKKYTFVQPSPFLDEIISRNQQYLWDNPFKILINKKIKNQTEYLSQLSQFGSKLNNIKNFEELQTFYQSTKLGCSYKQLLTVQNLALKIKNSPYQVNHTKQLKQHKFGLSGGPLSQEAMKWVMVQAGLDSKSKAYIHCKASKCNYDPIKFWNSICTIPKADEPSQLFVIQTNNGTGKQNKLIGFYTSVVPGNADMSKQSITEYIPDKDKKSLLLNINMKTVHKLVEGQHALAFNNKLLLCVGKCDIILSAFNITNLCYFPVSFKPDIDGYCSNADQLCGSKHFSLKQLYVYRFEKKA